MALTLVSYMGLSNCLVLNTSYNHKFNTIIPIFRSSALKLANHLGYIGTGEVLYDNELFRIGGTKLLRGFNEEVIFASFYSVFSLEYRLLFNQNSNLFVFSDLGYTEQITDLTQKIRFAHRIWHWSKFTNESGRI